MKILCISDEVDPLVYSNAIRTRFSDVSLVLAAGDLPMEYLGFIASSLNVPVAFVFGNHNLKELPRFKRGAGPRLDEDGMAAQLRNYFGATFLEDRVRRINGLLILGFGGSIRYNDGHHQFTDFEMNCRLVARIPRLLWNRLVHGRFLDVLVTHAPPLGVNDRDDPTHRGFRGLRWFLRLFRPRVHVHGHIHLYDRNAAREARLYETRVINVFGHFVLELGATDELDG